MATSAPTESVLQQWIENLRSELADAAFSNETFRSAEALLRWLADHDVATAVALRTLGECVGIGWRNDLRGLEPSAEFVARYPISLAREKLVIGFAKKNGRMPVGIASYDAIPQLDVITRWFRTDVEPFFADERLIQTVINDAYQQRGSETMTTIEALDRNDALAELKAFGDREDLLDTSARSPVVRLVNSVLFDAVKTGASDVHIQPYEDRLQVRFRIDGVLFDQFQVPKINQEEILSRVKVIGKMNIAEKRLPQDGRATVQIGDRLVDLRIASLPTSFGERIVIRLLDKGARLYTLGELGMADEVLNTFRELVHLEHGLILVTGPTGSGKSTTLYAALQEINSKDRNVVTLEDPIEYQLEGISQTQINEKKGMTFARGLRNILRQDPDIIMVGEIRDRETAEMAIQSALTGHMVYSTLHTNDAASAITRLLDLGIEPYLVASSVVGVLAQRLVRRICENCKVQTKLKDEDFNRLSSDAAIKPATVYQGEGCTSCRDTGYSGRFGLFELMVVDTRIREMVQKRCNAAEIRDLAESTGMKLLRQDGLNKILRGQTTIDEVIRVSTRAGE